MAVGGDWCSSLTCEISLEATWFPVMQALVLCECDVPGVALPGGLPVVWSQLWAIGAVECGLCVIS